jgi:hypothetical protein
MKIQLDNTDVRTLMLDSFVNGGLSELYSCDCFIDWDNTINDTNYDKAKALIKKEQAKGTFEGTCGSDTICREDVYIKMLEKYGIIFKDECSGDDDGNILLTFDMAKKNLKKALDNDNEKQWFLGQVQEIIPEYKNADAYTYFHILQGALFSEVIYG